MALFRRILILAAFAALAAAVTGCERSITRVEVAQEPQSCFSCHSDQNTRLVDAEQQWENSRHSTGSTLHENDSSCKGCHTSEGFIARATGAVIADVVEDPTAIHCFTCHAPHTNGDFRLRWTTPPPLANGATFDLGAGNLCVACHQARRNVATYVAGPGGRLALSSRWGPHYGTQADMMIGTNGYEYAGYSYERTAHREATGGANGKDGCIECHMRATSQYVVGGHSFEMRANANEPLSGVVEVLNVGACTPCHGVVANFNTLGAVQDSVDLLVSTLKTRLVTAGLLDAATDRPRSVTTSADSAGAVWNYLVAKYDRSRGVHNAKYIKGLLRSSILRMGGPAPMLAHSRNWRD